MYYSNFLKNIFSNTNIDFSLLENPREILIGPKGLEVKHGPTYVRNLLNMIQKSDILCYECGNFQWAIERFCLWGGKKKKSSSGRIGLWAGGKVSRKWNKIIPIQRKGTTRKTKASVQLHYVIFLAELQTSTEVTKLLIFRCLSLKISIKSLEYLFAWAS